LWPNWGEPFIGFNGLMKKLELNGHHLKDFEHARMKSGVDVFGQRPIPRNALEYAALDVSLLHAAAETIKDRLSGSEMTMLLQASQLRASGAELNDGARSICFDTANEYLIASAELLRTCRPAQGFFGEILQVANETKQVIDLLPARFRLKFDSKPREEKSVFRRLLSLRQQDEILEVETNTLDLDRLNDIVLDIGRRPQCWIGDERVFLVDNDSIVVSADDLKHVSDRLGEFGSDNRAGLNGKLHRFSAIRNRDDQIAGLTVRIGRHVFGNAAMFLDLLYGDKSILILGEPGSGKMTIVREATRKLAESKNVFVVDTSNEIAGDGLIPHDCIGLARRMMVPSLDRQSAVMVECVQNHTPHVMVIDEIGRPKEVEAARTVKQRGVRIIASAHGDLRKLLKNKDLRGLVGGIEVDTMGDDMAKQEAKRKKDLAVTQGEANAKFSVCKTKVERASEPTFDVIVEVRRGSRHEWRIVPDAAKAVDAILNGFSYKAELRSRDSETGELRMKFVNA
jgi:stage III sporulation protein SpoIIIAA